MSKPTGTSEADIVCQAARGRDRPHRYVLARVVRGDGGAHTLEVTPGVRWTAIETSGGYSIELRCPKQGHGIAQVDLQDLHRRMKSTRRKLIENVLTA